MMLGTTRNSRIGMVHFGQIGTSIRESVDPDMGSPFPIGGSI
jgi:hypothetical protein